MFFIRWILAMAVAYLAGKCISRLKLPSILGWLIAGMVLGPHALNLLPQDLLDSTVYKAIVDWMQVSFGVMLGTELIWKKMKSYGKALMVTTLYQSLGTFLVVSAAFAILFAMQGVPVMIAFLFGGIALATAPAPALSIVKEYHTKGPVTDTLVPMTILDDVVGIIVFFAVNAVVTSRVNGQSAAMSLVVIPVMIFVPILVGAAIGFLCGKVLQKVSGAGVCLAVTIAFVTVTFAAGWSINTYLLSGMNLNYMLLGVAFSACFANMIEEEKLDGLMKTYNPVLVVSMLGAIVDLGAPLDYHLILGAGVYTFMYIAFRAAGKYFGARLGATVTHLPDTVRRYLGLTLLPHSGVSLVFTNIACNTLAPMSECVQILQGTIAAAAVINEIIAVIVAKKGFSLAGEIQTDGKGAEVSV